LKRRARRKKTVVVVEVEIEIEILLKKEERCEQGKRAKSGNRGTVEGKHDSFTGLTPRQSKGKRGAERDLHRLPRESLLDTEVSALEEGEPPARNTTSGDGDEVGGGSIREGLDAKK